MLFLLVIFSLSPFSNYADGAGHIIFLTIEVSEGSVQIISLQVRPGELKSLRSDPGSHTLVSILQDADGKPLWQTVAASPLIERLEYADSTGTLHSTVSHRDRAQITVRLPFIKGAHSVRFSLQQPSLSAPAQNSLVHDLGTVTLDIPVESEP